MNPTSPETTATSSDTETFICPSRFGLYPDPKNCSLFYQCSHWIPYHKLCPSNLHFNPVLTVCDWPYRAGCGTFLTTVVDQTTTTSNPEPTTDTYCDCDSCELPIPDDCSSYILCIDNAETRITCASGLLFNVVTSTCDFEDSVKCDPNVQCPNPTGRFPYPNSCTHFMDCTQGAMSVKKCPEGMTFDKSNRNCSLFNFCEDSETSEITTEVTNTETTTSGGAIYISTDVSTTKSTALSSTSISTDTSTEEITSSDSGPVTNTSSPASTVVTDRSTVTPDKVSITTTTGEDVVITTVPVLVTDDQTPTSVSSTRLSTEKVSSTIGMSTTPTDIKTASEGKTSTTTSQNTTPISNVTSDNLPTFICPSRVGLFPDPESCFRFYHCSHWIPHHKWCPSDLHFNPVLQVCDWPYRAGCNDKSINPTKSDERTTKSDKSTTNSDENGPTISNRTCDCECCFTPDDKDCSKYLLCLNGTLYDGHCSDGLLFNPQNSNCDLADRVNCSKTSITCSSPNGKEPNPNDCTSFYNCTNGKPVLQECPKNKHFSVSRKECLEPCEARCDQTLDCPNKTSTPAPESAICIEDEGVYRSKNDCSSFYQCAEGQPYFAKCPYGQHFNVEYGVCEHPCDAKCDPNIDCRGRSYGAPAGRDASHHCPTPTGLYPVLQDCGSFYMCLDGKEHIIRCPPELHYSVTSGTCETPCKAGCNPTKDCKTPNVTTSTTSMTVLSPHCKKPNGSFSNPDDCGSYYQCFNGQERLVRCPDGLHFSFDDASCQSPCVASCDTTLECPIEIPDEDGNCTCENCFLPDPTDCSAYHFCSNRHLRKGYCPFGTLFDKTTSRCEPEGNAFCEAVGDPAMCPEPYGYNPYPGDCKKFVHCVDTVAYVRQCEKGLEFDPIIRACSNPNGHCGNSSIDSNCIRPTGVFPHPKNCSLFYQCENGAAYLKECPSPLAFNSIDEMCDWPNNVNCEAGQSEIQKSASKKKSHSEATCNKVPGVTCPCACRVTTYDECSSFFHCQEDGTACKRFCPEGLYFNRRKMVCDLPQNVECRDFFFTAMKRMKVWNLNDRKRKPW